MTLLGPARIRELAQQLQLRPSKARGQNFLHDANTIRRIVRTAGVEAGETILEIGPGLGSLTLGLLEAGALVTAVEIDPLLASALPGIVAAQAPDAAGRLTVVPGDATRITSLPATPAALVANLPYNVAVPVLLHVLARFPSITRGLVMVQREVAQRLAAPPGSKVYGVPSVKLAWYAAARLAGPVPRQVFWPVPGVDSHLVAFTRRKPPAGADRVAVFALIDAAFASRRKALRSALAGHFGSPAAAEIALRRAGIDPGVRGEALDICAFAAIAAGRPLG
ncbi:MAG TPA: 16S rRNA (adenine(1518)-N(6)/adenine(1519)-N(6))-dimethyltransferase RsmA [Mycobacteriales bacterium]|nr:16S rRNA (adenine(1518)-N(6)/adenine(1519)-N(6))-dimethyltransferase RsmA [Mycobacteriales bacterium]